MNIVRSIIPCVVVCAMVLTAIAASPTARPPAPTPVNRVVISLKDGTSIGGELIEATPAGVTVRPGPKASPITKPWSAIKQLGNGMTRASIVAQWRTLQKELLCDACDGEGATTCPTCSGKGVDPATSTPCAKCEGSGSTGPCKTPRCVGGKIPCPMTCLKPTDFHGPPDADGKRWKSFPMKGGSSLKWSDFHVGQLIVYENGQPVNKGVCPRCGGTSVIDDPACAGTGKQPCATCKGKGVVGPPCPTCKDGSVACATCNGTGLKASTTRPGAAKDAS